jgi:GT2 family glycosyltransferase
MPIKFEGRKPVVDIIMPTHDNHMFVAQAIRSILKFTNLPYRLFVVNNHERELKIEVVDLFGKQIDDLFKEHGYDCYFLKKLEMGENKGWMGGINAGIKHIMKNEGGLSKYVLFINDDIQIIDQQYSWLSNMVNVMEYYPEVGAVGPISNAVMHRQSINWNEHKPYHEESVLSGFCFLTRREVIEKIGVLDETLFGGDDVDYSIRIREAGYKLVCCRRSFVFHYYAQTGRRLHADWDTRPWAEKIDREIIRKHGLRKLLETKDPIKSEWDIYSTYDFEKTYVQKLVPDNGAKVIDMGCGNSKVHDSAIGVDIIPNGEYGIGGGMRFAPNRHTDVIADISKPMPMFEDDEADYIVGKHVLEHIIDYMSTLKEWHRILKRGGRLVIVLPDYTRGEAITCDPTHVHVFDKDSLSTALDATGYKILSHEGMDGIWSTVTVAEKI